MTQTTTPAGTPAAPPPASTATTTTTTAARRPSLDGSLYAMSDDEEGGYNTITHTAPDRGVKLLYAKSKVYIHPTPSAKDNIPGFLALLQQKPARLGDGQRQQRRRRPSSSAFSVASLDSTASEVSNGGGASAAAADLLLAWLPESSLGDAASIYVKVDLEEDDEEEEESARRLGKTAAPPRQTYLVPPPPIVTAHRGDLGAYAFAVPVAAIYSLLVRPPSIGWWFGSVIVNTRGGESFPALFFHDSECASTLRQKRRRTRQAFDPFGEAGTSFWGGDEVLRWLRRYVHVQRSGAEPNIYLVDPSPEDSEAFGGKLTTAVPTGTDTKSAPAGGPARPPARPATGRDGGLDPFTKFVKETGWNIMEKFSKVTTFTRNAAQNVLEDPRVPPPVRRLLHNPDVQHLQDDFDSARLYLARWAMGMAEQSERERHQRVWTAHDLMALEDTGVGAFELVDSTAGLALEERRKPVTLREWRSFFDPRSGRLAVTTDEVKERVFHGGLGGADPDADPDDPDYEEDEPGALRKEAWLFLLGVHDWHATAAERAAHAQQLRDAYVRLKAAWWERLVDLGGAGDEGEWWREQRGRIEKDVHRTDRNVLLFAAETMAHPDPDSPFAEAGSNAHLEQLKDLLLTYNEYNRSLGYVQGMSDLLAPLYAVVQDDALAFWAFQHFMDRMERNFLRDQSGMRAQLLALDHLVQFMDPALHEHLRRADSTNFFFLFRMLLVWFKREFDWADVLRLWEALWTDYLSSSFHLFVALAVLEHHRDVVLAHLHRFDEVLKYFNDLSGTIDLDATLVRAEQLFRRFQRLVEAVDKQDNFPAPRRQTAADLAAATSGPAAPSPDVVPPKSLPQAPQPARLRARNSSGASNEDDDAQDGADDGSGGQEMVSMAAARPSTANGDRTAAASTAAASPKAAGKRPESSGSAAANTTANTATSPKRIITPDLRALLSRTIFVVPRDHDGEDVLWGHVRAKKAA